MGCNNAYASGWEYSRFWCVDTLLRGTDNSGGAANAALEDTIATFLTSGIVGNVGQVLYNLTQGTDGPVTTATETTLIATGVTWNDGDSYRISTMRGSHIVVVEGFLDITASDIHAALAASGACDCVLASWAPAYLAKLNIIEAGLFNQCPCDVKVLNDEDKRLFLEWINDQMDKLRDGRMEVCLGETGSEFPAVGFAEQATTEFAAVDIIWNERLRNL